MRDTAPLAVVGGGNMGAALVGGLLAAGVVDPAGLTVVEVDADRRRSLETTFPGVSVVAETPSCSAAVIAVKPPDVSAAAAAAVRAGARRVLSIAAGVTIATIEAACGPGVAVVRSMPNTPALVGQGASAISGGTGASDDDLAWARSVLGSVGLVVTVPEAQLDAVTGLTGSGPAYLFLVAESLMKAGVDVGLERDVVDVLVRQLFTGASALMAGGDDPAELRVKVTSPNGTTAAGLAVLDAARPIIVAAVEAATARSRELGRST